MSPTINQILHINRSGMLATLLDLDGVSNNLANVQTIGYKSSRSNFQELLDARRYGGVQIPATQRFMDQGSLTPTGRPLDLAVNGEGFFALTLPDERVAYTRDGQFGLDAERQIVNQDGLPLVWDGEIPEDASEISVYPDGAVWVLQGETWNQAGTVELTRFPNPSGLESYGGNLWLETPVSGAAEAGAPGSENFGDIVASTLEQSNVNIANEMTQMIALQRSFQMSLRSFQQTDQMIALAIQMRR